MNDAYYNQGVDMLNLMGDLETDRLEEKYQGEIKEKARLWAEGYMPDGWDRKDHIMIGIFYKHYVDYFFNNYNFRAK